MTTPSITLYLDIVSPFSYVAFHVLRVRNSLLGIPGSINRPCTKLNMIKAFSRFRSMQHHLCSHLPGRIDERLWQHATGQDQE